MRTTSRPERIPPSTSTLSCPFTASATAGSARAVEQYSVKLASSVVGDHYHSLPTVLLPARPRDSRFP